MVLDLDNSNANGPAQCADFDESPHTTTQTTTTTTTTTTSTTSTTKKSTTSSTTTTTTTTTSTTTTTMAPEFLCGPRLEISGLDAANSDLEG